MKTMKEVKSMEVKDFEVSTEDVEFMENDMKKIMAFFKGSKWLFKDAIKTGIEVYGEEVGGYRPEDKYVIIDKEHPFGTALYSSSDDELIDIVHQQVKDRQGLTEEVSDDEIFDILGIEEENRDKSKGFVAQYKELEKKYPQASIWLKGDVDVYVKGNTVGETQDLSAIEENMQEGGQGSGNFKSGAQRHNDKLDNVFRAYDKRQQKFADFLISKGVSQEEVDKLKQDSGLHGNPLQQKFIELGGKIVEMKESVEPELPTEVTIDLNLLVDDGIDIESAFLDDTISDWLSDNYGFVHFGFEYDVIGDKVFVTNIAWDTSDDDLDESMKLNEGTGNFGTNKIINLCSPYQDQDDFKEYREEEKEENPELSDSDLDERVSELIGIYYTDMYEQVEQMLEPVKDFVFVEPGYYEGFYIKFNIDNGSELSQELFMYNDTKEDMIEELKTTVAKIEKALADCINEGFLVGYGIAYRFSNGETGYNLTKNKEKDLEALHTAMNKLLEEGLADIEEYIQDEIED